MINEQVKIIADAIKASGNNIAKSIDEMSYDIAEIKYSIKSVDDSLRNNLCNVDTSDLGYIVQAITDFTKVFKEQCKIGGALNKPPYK